MAEIDFPASLPCPSREGYSTSHVSPFVRTGMASGRARQRRVFTSVPSMMTVSWLLTIEETRAFEAWFRDSINDGADWFNARIRTPLEECDELGLYECRFTEMYSGPSIEGACDYRISANLEVFERPLLPDGYGLFPDYIIDADILDVAMNELWLDA